MCSFDSFPPISYEPMTLGFLAIIDTIAVRSGEDFEGKIEIEKERMIDMVQGRKQRGKQEQREITSSQLRTRKGIRLR